MRNISALLGCTALIASVAAAPAVAADWPVFGASLSNLASNPSEQILSKNTVAGLAPKWVATVGGDVSARAAVVDGIAYFPDWAGNLWALNTATGKPVWQHTMTGYGLPAGTVSRTTPAVDGNIIYFGTQQGAYLVAIDKSTGALRWVSQMDTHPLAIITASPAVKDGVIYTGVASNEEGAAANPSYTCCSFRGSVLAADARTGKILWKTFTVPEGYSGGAVWGSNMVVDAARQEVFIGTGDNYSVPTAPAYVSCVASGGTAAKCAAGNDYFDSLLALDMNTGRVKWSRRLASSDDWNVACFSVPAGSGNCPVGAGKDYDFGSAPQEYTIKLSGGGTRTIIGAGQKSGVYWAFDADTRKLLWATQVGPGSSLGGIEWGSASDGKRIYVAISNFGGKPYAAGKAGSWSALDPATGAVLWRTPDPNGAIDLGPLAVANGVVYAPSMAGQPSQASMFALNAASGDILWSFTPGSSVIAGATIVDGSVYWGSGYAHLGLPGLTGNTKFFAFSLAGTQSAPTAAHQLRQ
jgi:polyvinyl alcohol dehydrogenase (cytochrome)